MRKTKLIIFIILIIILIIVFFYGIFGTGLSYLSSKEIKQNRKLNKSLINNLKINNINTINDKNSNTYYYTLSKNYENKLYVLKLELEDGLKYKIIDETLNIIRVDYNKPIKIIIYNDKYYYETKVQLTNLPLINIETNSDISTIDTNSIFTYIDYENNEIKYNNKIRIRGASSKRFDKKSYKINIFDENYNEEKEINISNFYYGNSFILDSVYRDFSKIRNVLSTEIWNRISDDFSTINIYSEFVELFINNEYKGLYVFTEPINRRRLNLNKTIDNETSVVIKVQQWNYYNDDLNFSNITSKTFLGYELKYPNDEDLYKISWDKVLTNMFKYYEKGVESSYEIISSVFNINNYIDMIIFNAFTNNVDNKLDKNNYLYLKSLEDNKIYIQPWDMEYTFGIKYTNENDKYVSKNMMDYNKVRTQFYHPNAPEINRLLIDRYWELRKDILTREYFDNLLDKYKNELSKGVALRDSKLWYEYDIEKEIEDIRIWLYNRLKYFDSYVRGLENE